MRFIKYTQDEGFTMAVNLDLVIGINFHPNNPNIHNEGPRLHFRFAGDREGTTIFGDEAKRVWEIVRGLIEN